MNALDAALRDVQHGLDHRMIRPRPVCEATVQLDLLGARERHLHAAVETIDDGIVEHDGGAIRHRRQAEHAAAALAPIHHEGVLRDAVGERRRRGEFGDDALGIVDLGDDQDVVELRRERRLAGVLRHQGDAGAGALDLEAEREAGDRALGAIVDAAGLGLLRPPGVCGDFGLRGRIEPETAPRDGEDQEDNGGDEKAPAGAAACGNGHI
ncbi:hypothetical protein ACVWZ3_007794 [Bradyrhizobium sp. i1.3.6]